LKHARLKNLLIQQRRLLAGMVSVALLLLRWKASG